MSNEASLNDTLAAHQMEMDSRATGEIASEASVKSVQDAAVNADAAAVKREEVYQAAYAKQNEREAVLRQTVTGAGGVNTEKLDALIERDQRMRDVIGAEKLEKIHALEEAVTRQAGKHYNELTPDEQRLRRQALESEYVLPEVKELALSEKSAPGIAAKMTERLVGKETATQTEHGLLKTYHDGSVILHKADSHQVLQRGWDHEKVQAAVIREEERAGTAAVEAARAALPSVTAAPASRSVTVRVGGGSGALETAQKAASTAAEHGGKGLFGPLERLGLAGAAAALGGMALLSMAGKSAPRPEPFAPGAAVNMGAVTRGAELVQATREQPENRLG